MRQKFASYQFVKNILIVALCVLNTWAAHAQRGAKLTVTSVLKTGAFTLADPKNTATVLTDTLDYPVVQIAARAFCTDVQKITGKQPALVHTEKPGQLVIAGTLGHAAPIDELVAAGKLDADAIKGKWEAYCIKLVDKPFKGVSKALVVMGSDKRGTAYGLFELSRQMGVHPFYWWADVKPQHKAALYVTPGDALIASPSVKFRGIFLNDEDWGLQPWAAKNMDTDVKDIGPKTYEKIFELLLRLKANYIWPAMHPCTKAFWYYKENPVVAEKYGIVLGASHCEPMLRNNVFEWAENYEQEYGKKPGDWRYDLNHDQIYNYWNDRVKASVNNDAVYTVGMRGIHDGSMPGPKSKPEKVKLLEQVIRDQRLILRRDLQKPSDKVPQIFCPYKEVLDLYQAGMQLPDDVTIAWADDNHGYIRQLSNPAEQKRSGGGGVYYHLSYWGAPKDYLWLSSNSPSLIAYEMSKAYRFGAGNLWVFNVGDLKPAEAELQFCMDMAWDINRWTPENAYTYPEKWATEIFGKTLAAPIARIKATYYRLAANAKPEHMLDVNFTPAEAEQRLKEYQQIAQQAEALKAQVPAALQDAYFELVWYPVQGAKLMNEKILYARKSLDLAAAGNKEALTYSAKAKQAFEKIQQITDIYNTKIAAGKWNGIISWHPRNQKVFEMPPVATEASVSSTAVADKKDAPATVISASAFTASYAPSGSSVKALTGLGINGKGISVLPFIEKSYDEGELNEASYAEYKVQLTAGEKKIVVKCLPTFRIYSGLELRYGISVNGGPVKMVSIATKADTKDWGVNVMQGFAKGETTHTIETAGPATIRIYLPDPGLVVNTIEVVN